MVSLSISSPAEISTLTVPLSVCGMVLARTVRYCFRFLKFYQGFLTDNNADDDDSRLVATRRDDSPWHPTMRLFRQPRPGDCKPVVKAAAKALANLAPTT